MSSIDFIIPCYNPTNNWATSLIEAIKNIQLKLNDRLQLSVILINDGSNQNVLETEFNSLRKNIPNLQIISYTINKGKGYALRKGVEQSKADYIVFTDIDFPYTNDSLLEIIANLTKGNDVALGYRNNNYYNNVPLSRKFISKVLRFFLKKILKIPITDTQCGLKGFNQKGKELFLKTKINRFLFDLEFVLFAIKNKQISIVSVNVKLKEGIVFSKVNPKILIREFLNFIIILIRS